MVQISGQDLADVVESFGRADHVGPDLGQRQRLFDRPEGDVATHPCREVDDRIDVGRPNPIDDFGVVLDLTRRRTGDRVANVDVHDRCARPRRCDAVVGDGLGSERHLVGLADGVAAAGDGAGDEC